VHKRLAGKGRHEERERYEMTWTGEWAECKGGTTMDILRKTMLLGLGLISLTKEKAEGMVDDLVKRGEVASEDRFKAVEGLLKEAEKQEEEFTRKITKSIHKVIGDLGLPTRKDMDEVLKALRDIEKRLPSSEEKKTG
jgi:polyhydroxyalkanoate synthesis regulator phasin